MCHLHPDLVVTARKKVDFQLRLAVRPVREKWRFFRDGAVCKLRFFGPRRIRGADAGGVGTPVPDDIVPECAGGGRRNFFCQGPVVFSEGAACELRVQRGSAFFVFAKTRRPDTGWSRRWITAR